MERRWGEKADEFPAWMLGVAKGGAAGKRWTDGRVTGKEEDGIRRWMIWGGGTGGWGGEECHEEQMGKGLATWRMGSHDPGR